MNQPKSSTTIKTKIELLSFFKFMKMIVSKSPAYYLLFIAVLLLFTFDFTWTLEEIPTSNSQQYEENAKCTEHKGNVGADFLLHVPCLLIRIMEYMKSCPISSYMDTFLSNFKNLILKINSKPLLMY